MFQAEAGATREEKEINACTGGNPEKPSCAMFPTKYREIENSSLEIVEWFVAERRSGFSPNPLELTPNEYEAVKIWDSLNWQYDLIAGQSVLK